MPCTVVLGRACCCVGAYFLIRCRGAAVHQAVEAEAEDLTVGERDAVVAETERGSVDDCYARGVWGHSRGDSGALQGQHSNGCDAAGECRGWRLGRGHLLDAEVVRTGEYRDASAVAGPRSADI